jgi:hypothetical protein
MTQLVKKYKIALDNFTTNSDKTVVVNLGDAFQFYDKTDEISSRAETIMDEIFSEQNPTIDFEKYRFKPITSIDGFYFYFYRQVTSTLNPVTYDDTIPPVWYFDDPTYSLSSGYNKSDIPDSLDFLNSYFKFEFFLDPISQKSLFSISLPLNGTMLNPGQTPRPKIDFHQSIKTEVENIFWLRKPEQLPGAVLNGNLLNLYCNINFFNNKNSKMYKFKWRPDLPTSSIVKNYYTSQDNYIIYQLNYTDLTYKILNSNGLSFIDRIKLYSL